MQEGGGALGITRGGEDRPLVVLEHAQPILDIAGVILARLRRQTKVGGQKSASEFGHKFFGGGAFISPTLAPEFTIEPGRMACVMRHFMG